MYASQVWGTEYIREGKEISSELQVRHTSFLKGTLGVERATSDWAVSTVRASAITVLLVLVRGQDVQWLTHF
eukprot:210230-Pelagomonas_calceolata.AAC.1